MTICFFGNYIPDYPRIVVLKKGLTANGVHIVECQTRRRGFAKYWGLYRQHRRLKNSYDVLLVGMAGYSLMWFARLLTKKPVVLDAFVSLYLTEIEDRARSPRNGWRSWYLRCLEKSACNLAYRVLLDTQVQIDYFVTQYHLSPQKFIRVLVGADNEIFFPRARPSPTTSLSKFVVHWHGHIVPFHGAETILQAAALLQSRPDIEFHLITRFNSQYRSLKVQAQQLQLHNIVFFPETDYHGLADALNQADLCLGVFGKNKKTALVVPNKIFEAVACRKPVITADTPAIREAFPSGTLITCAPADPRALAEAILSLRDDQALRETLAQNTYELYTQKFTPLAIGQELLFQLNLN
jgi:glycosyltransferase involved in cell wall biosynthesis